MAVEEARVRLRAKLEEMFGVDEASILMDRPPGGWNDLVTHRDLDAFEARIEQRFNEIDRRFVNVDQRFPGIDQRFADIDQRFADIDQRFADIDRRFVDLEAGLDRRFAELDERLELRFSKEIAEAFAAQTWRFVGAITALMAVVVAAVKL